MRCLTLADALQQRGGVCHFICRDMPGNLVTAIAERGFTVHVLPPSGEAAITDDAVPHAAWLGVDWEIDAVQTAAAITALLPTGIPDWLIVDHYALDVRWENALRPYCRLLFAIDDLADRNHDCDGLLDQNIGRQASDYAALVPPYCKVFAGTTHAILRPEFANLRHESLARRASAPLRRLLITMGGVDKNNATSIVIKGLALCSLPADLTITIVMGAQAPWREQVIVQTQQLPWATDVISNVNDMAALMSAADIAIGAAGTTTWERCCLGLPSLVLGTAENQRYVLSQLQATDAVVVGDLEQLMEAAASFAPLMARLVDHRDEYARRAAALTDGQGCLMLAHYLLDVSASDKRQ